MKLSEEQIKEILQYTQTKLEADPQLEDTILAKIKDLNHYDQRIQQSKRRGTLGLRISLATTFCLILSLLYSLFANASPNLNEPQVMLPSFMVIVMLLMLYQLVYFSTNTQQQAKT